MQNYPLPLKDFVLAEKTLPQILMTSPDSQLVVECDLKIHEDLHGYFQDFPIAPTREIVTMDMLSTDQIEMLARLNVKTLSKVPKLMQTLNPKHKYVLHFLTLILYVQLGIEVKQIHRVLQFKQAKWLAPFAELRRNAVNKFQQDFHKNQVNSAFGRTMESMLNRKKVEIVTTEMELLEKTSKSNMKSFQIIDDQIATLSLEVSSEKWTEPNLVGAETLDLAKK